MKKTVLAVKNVAKQAKAAAKQAVKDIKNLAKQAGKIAAIVTSGGFKECLSAAADFIPVVGNIKSGIEFITGKDPITGRKLEQWEQGIAAVGIIGGPAAKAVKHGGKLAVKGGKVLQQQGSKLAQQGSKLLEKGGNLLEKASNVLDTSRTQLAGAGVGAGYKNFSLSTGISTGKKTGTGGSKQGNLPSSSSGRDKGNVASKGTEKPNLDKLRAEYEQKVRNWKYKPNFELYVKYRDVYNNPKYYDQETGDIHWPKNNGFVGKPVTIELQVGTMIDRYGGPGGKFLSPAGTPFEQRALAPHSELEPYHKYKVVEPFSVQAGEIAPWFDQPGGGTQYYIGGIKVRDKNGKIVEIDSVNDLLDYGYIEEIIE